MSEMQKTPEYGLVVHQGADWAVTMTYTDENDLPIDLTSYEAQLQVRRKPGGDLLLDMSTDNGKITIVGASGEIGLALANAVTAALAALAAEYDLFIKSPGGTYTPLVRGDFTVIPRVTKVTI
jgi:hypothetical protein